LFEWDAAHQLVRADVARGPDEVATRQTYAYAYDALGRRVAKSDAFRSTCFAWDGNRMALERRGGNEIAYLYHPESFVPLAQLHDGVVHHLHTDHLGTPLEASNDVGEVTWTATYRTWGNVVVEEVAEIQQQLRFQGQYFDGETGFHYNRFRYYSGELSSYISADPVGLAGGLNQYSYGYNPIIWTDPLGLTGLPVAAGTAVNRVGGNTIENLRLKEREKALDPPGISVLLSCPPCAAAEQMRKAFPDKKKYKKIWEDSKTVASGPVEAIREAGFDVIYNPTDKFPNHGRIVHPDGEAGFNDENLKKLSNALSTTTACPP
jgi:RHS repeat-associated protein